MKFIGFLFLIACGSAPPAQDMPEWIGKTREEVKVAFSQLTPKTEEDKISYRDSDPLPTPARCSVIPCWPVMGQRISCRYVFKFKDDRVTIATKSGNCRDKVKEQ